MRLWYDKINMNDWDYDNTDTKRIRYFELFDRKEDESHINYHSYYVTNWVVHGFKSMSVCLPFRKDE